MTTYFRVLDCTSGDQAAGQVEVMMLDPSIPCASGEFIGLVLLSSFVGLAYFILSIVVLIKMHKDNKIEIINVCIKLSAVLASVVMFANTRAIFMTVILSLFLVWNLIVLKLKFQTIPEGEKRRVANMVVGCISLMSVLFFFSVVVTFLFTLCEIFATQSQSKEYNLSLIPKKFISLKSVNCKDFRSEGDCTPRGGTHEDQCKWVNPGYYNHIDCQPNCQSNCQPKMDSERMSYRRSLEQEIVTLQSITIFLLCLSLIVIGISMGIAAKKTIEKMKKVTKRNKLTSLETKLLYPFLLIVRFVFAVLTRCACCRVGEEEEEEVEGGEQKEEKGIEMGDVASLGRNSSLELTQEVANPMNATGQGNKTFTVVGSLGGVQTAPMNTVDIKGALQLMYQTCAPNKLNKPGFVDNIVCHYSKKHGDNAWKQLCVTYQEVYHYDLEKYRADAAAQTAAQTAAQAAAKTTVETKTTTITMAPPWREILDPKSGRMYYYNSETNKTTWKRPK